ncbi:MAG TPA: hypothetical protein VF612_08155 [Jatrophihabitans sp.]|jgi:hypothetical protein|uniref:hypothetical protein n=1 Tax=Jatrophihabitans sp. TaxID=1932789 RepID=UPI002EEC2C1A
MTDPDLSDMPSTDGVPATEAPVVAGAGETFDDLDSTTPLSADGGPTQPGGQDTDSSTDEDGGGG